MSVRASCLRVVQLLVGGDVVQNWVMLNLGFIIKNNLSLKYHN